MSRIGRAPIAIPAGVTVTLEGTLVTVTGPKGTLTLNIHPNMQVEVEGAQVLVKRPNDEKENRSLHGLTRTLINNMVVGVSAGYTKELEIQGVGYRAAMAGKQLQMNLGYSHPVNMDVVDGLNVECPNPNRIVITGIDKQLVGQFAADVRKQRPPEPYKGKGIRYLNEVVRRKEGKAGAKKK